MTLRMSSMVGREGDGFDAGYLILKRSICVSGSSSVYAMAGSDTDEIFMNSFLRRSMTVILINSRDRISSTADSGNLVVFSAEIAVFEDGTDSVAVLGKAGEAWRAGCTRSFRSEN